MEELHYLPNYLRERCLIHKGPHSKNPSFVLYWMRTAMRLTECPTFDTARLIAKEFDLPLIIYQGIDERYPYASYRHHRFIMEGAADISISARKLGIKYLLHVSRRNNRPPALIELAREAQFVITDLMDINPWSEWTKAVAKICKTIEVDSHCVLPRPKFGKSLDRPFKFKDSTKKQMKNRIDAEWPTLNSKLRDMPDEWIPPFKPVDIEYELSKDGCKEILSSCNIDPTVVPVVDMIGGENTALIRWHNWAESNLKSYHRRRNNASDRNGVSGMSPWLHYGMIAATKLVRDAKKIGGKGPEKFIDEMLIFREHAHHHVHAIENAEEWNHIPSWAQSSWKDTTPIRPNLDSQDLERGLTGDDLWDYAQIGMLRHGVMHNNVRMTWGKGLVQWQDTPENAMKLALELNNRFALDGRDANSIAGVQWCFGLFDRPFKPHDIRMGTIRKRNTKDHSNRLDMESFKKWTMKSTLNKVMKIGIVGGGLSGLFAGRLLQDLGHDVTIWDKGRRESGRLANRVTNKGNSFQIGAIKLEGFSNWMDRFIEDWKSKDFVKYDNNTLYANDSFTKLLEYIGKDLKKQWKTKITTIGENENGISVSGIGLEDDKIIFDHIILAIPLEQAKNIKTTLSEQIEGRSEPNWVAWGPSNKDIAELPNGWKSYFVGNNSDIMVVRLDEESSSKYITESNIDMANIITKILGVSIKGWYAHKWKYSRAVEGPQKVISNDKISIIGDGFGFPIGTAGGAIDSAARAVAELHLIKNFIKIDKNPIEQRSLTEWIS